MKQFLELFNPLPGNHYLHITTASNEISKTLQEILSVVDGKLNLVLYNEENLDFTKPFRALPRDHDIVIFQDVFQAHKYKSTILKLAYTTLANNANIIILEKKGVMDINETKEILEKHEFRSSNEIDILDGYDLVIAKKMHMWGNGL
jgi:hypothetical protein